MSRKTLGTGAQSRFIHNWQKLAATQDALRSAGGYVNGGTSGQWNVIQHEKGMPTERAGGERPLPYVFQANVTRNDPHDALWCPGNAICSRADRSIATGQQPIPESAAGPSEPSGEAHIRSGNPGQSTVIPSHPPQKSG